MDKTEYMFKKLRAFNKVEDCIKSSKSFEQLQSCYSLIENFNKLFPPPKKSTYWSDIDRLTSYLNRKFEPFNTVAI